MNNLRNLALWIIIMLLLVALFNMFQGSASHQNTSAITYTQFNQEVTQNAVKDVTIQGDQVSGHVTIDLDKLIPVDGRFAAVILGAAATAQRPKHGEDRDGRHQREHKPQRHQEGSGGTAPTSKAPMPPLYTTGGKPGN